MNAQTGEVSLSVAASDVFAYRSRPFPRLKRVVDILICILVSPFALLVATPIALVLRLDGGRVLYAQKRVGADGRLFACLKFRSMVRDADERLQRLLAEDPLAQEEWSRFQKLSDDPRVTWFGRFLRAYSLDELPQFINVWRGEMSIVGPRPIMVDQIELYGDNFRDYCAMRPGITGPWQVNGRNDRTFAERVQLDTTYARTWSIGSDLIIMLRTIPAVLAGKGAR